MIGKPFTINLDDPEIDFKYNGRVLENDTLKDYTINSDIETIELEAILEIETTLTEDNNEYV